MSLTKDEIEQRFNKANIRRHDLPQIPRSTQQYLQYMDYKIRKQFKSFTILSLCGGAERANFIVDKGFERAFTAMTLEERTDYYAKYIDNILKLNQKAKKREIDLKNINSQHDSQEIDDTSNLTIPLKIGKGSKSFQQTQIVIQDYKAKSKNKNLFNIDLRNYLLRKSKKKNPNCYVLEATTKLDPQTVRFSFLSSQDQKKYLPIIKAQINQALLKTLSKTLSDLQKKKTETQGLRLKNPNSTNLNISQQIRPIPIKQHHAIDLDLDSNPLRQSRKPDLNKSVIEDIVKSRDQQQLDQELAQFINEQNQQVERMEKMQMNRKNSIETPQFRGKNSRNIFKIILPNYSLQDLARLNHYGSIYQSDKVELYIYLSVKDHSQFKMQFTIELPLETVCKALYNVQLFKFWHPEIDQGQIKLKISSENSCIIYQKTKAFSQWYKQRDYLLLTHLFRMGNAYYIVEKSVENSNFIPFQSITRGKFIYLVWKIEPEPKSDKPKCKVTAQLKVNHEGLLNKSHQKQLTLRYLKGFENMQSFYKDPQNKKKLLQIMGFQWNVSQRENTKLSQQVDLNLNSLRTCDFQSSQISQQDQIYYSIQDLSQQQNKILEQQQQQNSQHEIQSPKPPLPPNDMLNSQFISNKNQLQTIQTNNQGIILLPSKYLKKRHQVVPFTCDRKLMEYEYDNIVEKDHWVLEKGGGLKLINQVKIDAQNNVLKFIMKTLKKNLFSGKGILNISLPVQIFNVDSNIQRVCQGMSLGPEFLEPVAKVDDKVERFKRALAFGLSNSLIYFDVQKPFNPILGQTYQGFIRGCPVYGQQISHHPPITSVLLYGRGYKITASLQAKVHVHMNSGDGINQGFYHIIFDDGQQIQFQTPPAEISGLAMGDRRFNIKDRGLYFDVENGFFCEMKMEGTGGLFKKKREFTDQIQGDILKVKPEFMRKFLEANIEKKPSPSQSDIVQKIGELSGRWPLILKIDGKVYYDIKKDIPDRMVDDIYPLNSNSNYREDLYYRKKNDLSRSQIQKQRLEVIQRGDRKLREKFHGKSH